jgi:hypothetical protein
MSVAESACVAESEGMRIRLLRTIFAAVVATAALAVGAPAANAGVLVASAPDCSPKPTSKPFAPWGDQGDYWLAPGGSFEPGRGSWQLSGGASVVAGNEPWKVNRAGDANSLRLPPGASATSPVMCVGLEHPTLRLFARDNRALLSTLSVEVIFETSLGLKASAPVGVLLPSGQWRPSPRFLVVANLLPLLPGEHTPVQFRVRSVGLGTWWVDDFYVDPKCR